MISSREAHDRHARHYYDVLASLQDAYDRSGIQLTATLDQSDSNWGQIQRSQQWVSTRFEHDHYAAALCNAYTGVGIPLVDLRFGVEAMKLSGLEVGLICVLGCQCFVVWELASIE